ncbi:MAG TPA: oligosaccharide flippase family protein [Kofleriaceae bacterium]|nr:oligosaccharide flippase family protein [Kofleriaceae bacterium]
MTAEDGNNPVGDITRRSNRGMMWIGIASSTVGLLDLVAFVILVSFWISQEEVGVAAGAITLFPVLDLVTDLGLTSAVIQRDDHTPGRISTIFWLNVMLSLAVSLVLALVIGPLLAWWQGHAIIAWMLAAYGAKLVWQNVYFIPYALMKRELRFKELSVLRIIANLAEFSGKVGFAWAGFGVWCFVLGPFCRVLVTGIGTQILHPWRPKLVLNFRDAVDWTSYGMKTSASKILFHLYTKADSQVVLRFFGDAASGLYYAAYNMVLQPALVISEIVTNVAFPVFSRLKHDRKALIEQLLSFTRMNMVIMFLFIGVVVVSTDDMLRIFSMGGQDDYTSAAPAARILCLVALLRALSFVIPPLLDGMNKPMLTLRYMIIASIVMPLLFLLSAAVLGPWLDYVSVAVGWAVGYPIAFVALLYMATRVLELPTSELVHRVIGIPLCAAGATALSFGAALALDPLPPAVRFAGATVVFLVAYGVLLARYQGISVRSVLRSLKS